MAPSSSFSIFDSAAIASGLPFMFLVSSGQQAYRTMFQTSRELSAEAGLPRSVHPPGVQAVAFLFLAHVSDQTAHAVGEQHHFALALDVKLNLIVPRGGV